MHLQFQKKFQGTLREAHFINLKLVKINLRGDKKKKYGKKDHGGEKSHEFFRRF